MHIRTQALAALIATALLAGCSGGSRSALPSAPANQNTTATYTLQVDLTKLKAGANQPKYIAANVKSITVATVPIDPNSIVAGSTFCVNTNTGQTIYNLTAPAAPGFDTFVLYASTNACTGTGGVNATFTPSGTTPATAPSGGSVIGAIVFAPASITTTDPSVVGQAGPVNALVYLQANNFIGSALGLGTSSSGPIAATGITTTFSVGTNATPFAYDRGLYNLAPAGTVAPGGLSNSKEAVPLTLTFTQQGSAITSPDPASATGPGTAVPLNFLPGQAPATQGLRISVKDNAVGATAAQASVHHSLFLVSNKTGALLSSAAGQNFTYTTYNLDGTVQFNTNSCITGNGSATVTLKCALPSGYSFIVTYDAALQDTYQGATIALTDLTSAANPIAGTSTLNINAQTMVNTIVPSSSFTAANYQPGFTPVVANAAISITGAGTALPTSLGGGLANGGVTVTYNAGATFDIPFTDSTPSTTAINSVIKYPVNNFASAAPSANDAAGAAVGGNPALVNLTALTTNGVTVPASTYVPGRGDAIWATDANCAQCIASTAAGAAPATSLNGVYAWNGFPGTSPAQITAAAGATGLSANTFRNVSGSNPQGPVGIVFCPPSTNCPGARGSLIVAANNSVYRVDLATSGAATTYSNVTLLAGSGLGAVPGTNASDPTANGQNARFNFNNQNFIGLALGAPGSAANTGPTVVYVADPGNNAIRAVSLTIGSQNPVTTVAANFTTPSGLAFEANNGTVYANVSSLNQIYQVFPSAAATASKAAIFAGLGAPGSDGLGLASFPLQFNTGNPATATAGTATTHGSPGTAGTSAYNLAAVVGLTAAFWNDNDLAQNAGTLTTAGFNNPLGMGYALDSRLFDVLDAGSKKLRQVQ